LFEYTLVHRKHDIILDNEVKSMQKLLYITDQDEYVDHSFIAPLFEVYLKKYMMIDIVYFSEFKSDFERKDAHRFTVPARYKNVLLPELTRNDVLLESYDFVMVRNNITLMQHVLKYREVYRYKALFRFSFPKRSVKMSCDKAENKTSFLDNITYPFKTSHETKIINQCDAFLPTSKTMHQQFRPKVNIPTILCSPAIDPASLHENQQHTGEEKRFFYAGTLDRVREFETVLDAFSNVKSAQWKLMISTRDTSYAEKMMEAYPDIKDRISLYNAKTKNDLLNLIAKADIGVALLPDIAIYNSATPVKVFNYYSSAVPCLMTKATHPNTIFTDCEDAWFCDFTQSDITEKIEFLLTLSKDQVAKVGVEGQKRLLKVKNYETIAKDIAEQLETL
jgi:glycosyltransferase involved in cell wall biosynthesis